MGVDKYRLGSVGENYIFIEKHKIFISEVKSFHIIKH